MSTWARVTLDDVAAIERSGIHPEFIAADTIYVGLEHIGSDGTFLDPKPVTAGMLGSTKFQFTSRHLLYGKLRPYLAKIACPDFSGVCSTDILPILPGPKINRRFLWHFLRQPVMVEFAAAQAVGVNLPRLSPSVLAKVEISLPPLPEQQRIVEVLDRGEELRAQRRAALAQFDALLEALFFDIFGDMCQPPVTIGDKLGSNPRGWRWEFLVDVARLATGHTPDRKRPEFWNGDTPWIALADIRRLDGNIATETTEYITQAGIKNSSAVKLPAGTVCFSRTASVGFVTIMGREMATSQDFVNWVCGPRLTPIYLMHALLRSRERLRALSSGSTHKTIYFPTVEQFRVLVPPLSLQEEFARRVTAVNKLKTIQRAYLSELNALFASLQHRAFRGEL